MREKTLFLDHKIKLTVLCSAFEFDGDKQHMREPLTHISENGFAPLRIRTDREAAAITKFNVGGVVQFERATVIGLPVDVSGT